MDNTQEQILALKKEKGALILAHYYQTMDIQEVADHVCDSFEMARRAHVATEDVLVICGVRFMAESAKILNPGKTVLLPSRKAGCPMADMIEPEDVLRLRELYPDAAVVCYVNSSAAVKAASDVCCTSSSAERIVRALPGHSVIFVPDRNLGSYVASKVPEKEIILYDGFCPTHERVTLSDILAAKTEHPEARMLVHPECRPEILKYADYIGSTAGIIKEALDSNSAEYIIGTEIGVVDHLGMYDTGKQFYPLASDFVCPNMKRTRLSDVANSLIKGEHEITLREEEIAAARAALERMVMLG
jgi:quinolinate synthase